MKIIIVRDKITKDGLIELAREFYVEMVKGVADIDREIIALGGEWHIDSNNVLIEDGSKQSSLWGFNVYLDKKIEYTSLINIRPLQNNKNLEIEDDEIRDKIRVILQEMIEW